MKTNRFQVSFIGILVAVVLVMVMQELYDAAKIARVGEDIKCPVCEQMHVKRTYNNVFDRAECKDRYWNTVDEKRRCRHHDPSHYDKYNVGEKSAHARMRFIN